MTLSVPGGSIFGLLGRNGSGKSTLVRTLVGLIRPTRGRASVLGYPAGSVAARRQIGFLPEVFRHPDWATGVEVLTLHASLAELPEARRRARIATVLDLVGLNSEGHRRVSGYSKGMQQRLGIAVALLADPRLVFLDEPTSALDPVGRREVRELLVRLRQNGTTIFLNSHLLGEVEMVCDRVGILRQGRLVATGGLADLLEGTAERATILLRSDDTAGGMALTSVFPDTVQHIGGDFMRLVFPIRSHEDVPRAVQAVVTAGGRIYAVERQGQSLEEIFLSLVGGES